MVFTKDTTFLNLSKRRKRTRRIMELHIQFKHVFVDEKERDLLMNCYKFDCRSCGNTNLKRVVSLRLSTSSK